ncbi:MAG: hypothetical protein HQM03_14955 [Magnetococcales bacterium]|nr:hypothetical protein [Magnetococcales bacterium]
MASSQVSLIGAGRVFIGPRGAEKLRFVGQCKEFKLDFTEETKELKDYVKGVGVADSISFISKVETAITFASISVKNLAMALRGVESVSASQTLTSTHTGYPGGLIQLAGIGPTAVTVSLALDTWAATTAYAVGQLVKPAAGTHYYECKTAGTSGAVAPTWKIDGTDTTDGTATWADKGLRVLTPTQYEITSAGIFIPDTSTRFAETGTPVEVTYTTSEGSNIEALVKAGEEYQVVFAGKNFARSGKPLSVDMYRVKFSAPKDLAFIGDDFATLTLTGSLLSDDTKTGEEISAYCNIKMVG